MTVSDDVDSDDIETIQVNATTVRKQIPVIGEVYRDRSKIADNFAKI